MCRFRNIGIFLFLTTYLIGLSAASDKQKQHYAIIIQGSPETPFSNTATLAKEGLISFGIPQENLFMIGPFFQDKHESLVTFNARVGNEISKTLSTIKNKNLSDGEGLIIYFSGHGYNFIEGQDKQKSGIAFSTSKKNNANVKWDYEAIGSAFLQAFPDVKKTFIIDTCFSGSCVEPLKSKKTTIITSADASHESKYMPMHSKGLTYFEYMIFSYHFFSALKGEYPNGMKINADTNDDGKTSLDEAYEFSAHQENLGKPGPKKIIPILGLGLGKEDFARPQFYDNSLNECNNSSILVIDEQAMKSFQSAIQVINEYFK